MLTTLEILFIISDKIKNYYILLIFRLSKSSAKLLNKYNRGLCRAQHNHLIHFYNINTFIENINGENIIQWLYFICCIFRIHGKTFKRTFALLITIGSA